MLSRLMKYEMRSQSRLLLPLHALLLSGSIRVCLVMKDTWLLPCR